MSVRGKIAARAKAARRSHVAEARGLERRRGLISFLTWAFFLADLFGRDGVMPASAHASAHDETTPAHGTSDVAPIANDLADRPMTGLGDQSEPTTVSPGYTLHLQAPGGDAAPLDIRDLGGEGASAARTATHHPIDGGSAVATVISSAATDATHPAGTETAEPPSLLHATIAPDGLLDGVAHTLGELPLVGSLLGDTVHMVTSSVESLVGGLGGLLSPRGTDAAGDAAIASGGSIAFEPASSTASPYELETPHGFTDYGIALELGLPGNSVLNTAPSLETDVGTFSPDHDTVHLAISTDHSPANEAGQRASSDVLA